MAKWVLLADGRLPPQGPVLSATSHLVPFPWQGTDLYDAVRAAIEEYRQVKRADLIHALVQIELFNALPPEQIGWLADRIELRRYEAGEVVVQAGEQGDGVYMIRHGEVKVLGFEKGEELILTRRGRHEHFGEMSLLIGEARSNTVVTTLDSELFFLRKEDCDELLKAQPNLGIRLSQVLGTVLI